MTITVNSTAALRAAARPQDTAGFALSGAATWFVPQTGGRGIAMAYPVAVPAAQCVTPKHQDRPPRGVPR